MKRLLMFVVFGIVCALFLMPAEVAVATEMVWVPINPSFGGYAGNAQWLMASAQAQNKLVEKSTPYTSTERDLTAEFESRLYSQIMYGLANQIRYEIFGEPGTDEGLQVGETGHCEVTVGDNIIDISTIDGITVDITGPSGTTTVNVPYSVIYY